MLAKFDAATRAFTNAVKELRACAGTPAYDERLDEALAAAIGYGRAQVELMHHTADPGYACFSEAKDYESQIVS